ncbi:MAG: 4-hydroxy-tetrahydrodipicolinate reductase [Bacteroidota bacterium]
MSLKIAIIGYGKMGREIEKLAPEEGHDPFVIVDNEDQWDEKSHQINQADVAIEFTSPGVVEQNIKRLVEKNIPVVTGTTGWHKKLRQIAHYVKKCNGTLFYASNFSVGVNIFFAVNEYLAKIMKDYTQYRIEAEETHHIHKLDAPSGTAVSMLEDIMKNNPRYTGWKLAEDHPGKDEIPVVAKRIAGVVGEHSIDYISDIDTLSLKHCAHSREGFAKGALLAARWVKDKKGIFTMKDLLNI